jgi:hypothetical protein
MTTCHLPPDLPSIYGDGRSGRSLQPRQVVSGIRAQSTCRLSIRQVAAGGRS